MTRFIYLLLPIVLWAQTSTWDIIQNDIFEPNCIMCHDHGSYFAEQSGLILAEDIAYEELINVTPTNIHAAEDGLVLVGTNGIASVYDSFLWEKINANNYEHFYDDHPEYGSIMPMGMDFLTNGQLEFIRQWIIAGAPDSGNVASEVLLEDTTIFEIPDFASLPIPENGVQFHIGPFDVSPQSEREFFYFTEVDTQDYLYINRIETAMAPGSHHFVTYTFDDELPLPLPPTEVYRDLYNQDGSYNNGTLAYMAYNKFITGSQTRFFDYSLPEGVALKIDPTYGFDLNSHYANYSDETIQGEVYNNYHFVNPSDVNHIAEILQINADNLVLPPGDTTTINHIEWTNETMSIFQLWSHAHKLNLDFKIYLVTQSDPDYREQIYLAMDWEHPPIVEYDPPLVLHSGDGLELEATFYNDTDETVYFGLLSTDEMMILFGLYYEGEALETAGEPELIPSTISITNIFPNPFNPTTTIQFNVPVETRLIASLRIYDITGRMVETLLDEKMDPGNHEVQWNASHIPSGVYFVQLISGETMQTEKIILLK